MAVTEEFKVRRRIALGLSGLSVLVLVGCAFGGWGAYERTYDWRPAANELPAAVTAYQTTGLPWIAADLAPKPPVRPEENAGPGLRAGAKAMIDGKWSRGEKSLRAAADAGEWNQVITGLLPHRDAMAKFEAAAKRPRLDFRRDLDLGPNLLLPEFTGIRFGMRAFGLRARQRAASGDLDGARADLRTVRRNARLVESDVVLIGLLVRIAGEGIADDASQRAAAIEPRLARLLAEDLEGAWTPPNLARSARAEAYFGIATARNLKARLKAKDLPKYDEGQFAPMERNPARLRREGPPEGQVQRAYLARTLQFWTGASAELVRHEDDPVALGRALDVRAKADERKPGESRLINRAMLPVFAPAGTAVAKCQASHEITLAYLRAIEHRQRTGSFPKTPMSGKDPFGRPYVSRREGAGFRIYSIGSDGKDDGGWTPIERSVRGIKSDDIAAAYPPAARERSGGPSRKPSQQP